MTCKKVDLKLNNKSADFDKEEENLSKKYQNRIYSVYLKEKTKWG